MTSAELKLPQGMPWEEKRRRVDQIVTELVRKRCFFFLKETGWGEREGEGEGGRGESSFFPFRFFFTKSGAHTFFIYFLSFEKKKTKKK